MTRRLSLILTIFVFSFTACWAADSAIIGKWECTSTDDSGQTASWTLVVKDDGGKLAGTLSGDPGEFALVDPKMEGNSFTFKVVVNEVSYEVQATIDGGKLDGKFKGPEASGTLKGTKQS